MDVSRIEGTYNTVTNIVHECRHLPVSIFMHILALRLCGSGKRGASAGQQKNRRTAGGNKWLILDGFYRLASFFLGTFSIHFLQNLMLILCSQNLRPGCFFKMTTLDVVLSVRSKIMFDPSLHPIGSSPSVFYQRDAGDAFAPRCSFARFHALYFSNLKPSFLPASLRGDPRPSS